MAKGVIEVADLPDPVGKTLSDITRPNGLRVKSFGASRSHRRYI